MNKARKLLYMYNITNQQSKHMITHVSPLAM